MWRNGGGVVHRHADLILSPSLLHKASTSSVRPGIEAIWPFA